MKSVSHHVKKEIQDIVHSQDFAVVVTFFFCLEKLYTSAPPQSKLVLSGRYHIMSNASLVNNCILSLVKVGENPILCFYLMKLK